jgi:WD40 repeat protein
MLDFPCPNCGQKLRAREDLAGRRVRCPKCGAAAPVPEDVPEVPVADGTPHSHRGVPAWVWILGGVGLLGALGLAGLAVVGFLYFRAVPPAPAVARVEETPVPPPEPTARTQPTQREAVPPAPAPARPAPRTPEKVVISEQATAPVLSDARFRGQPFFPLHCLPDNRHVLASVTGGLAIVDLEDDQATRTFRVSDRGGMSVALSADGRRLLTGSGDGAVKLWDLQTILELKSFTGHDHQPFSVALSADGRLAAAVAYEPGPPRVTQGRPSKAVVWEVETGRPLGSLAGQPRATLRHVAFHPDGRRVLLGYGQTGDREIGVKLWDPQSGAEEPFLDLRKTAGYTTLTVLAVAADGSRVLTTGSNGPLTLWDARSGEPERQINVPGGHGRAAFSPDGARVLCYGGGTSRGRGINCNLHVLDAATGRELVRCTQDVPFLGAAMTPDGRRVLSTGSDRRARVWELPAP